MNINLDENLYVCFSCGKICKQEQMTIFKPSIARLKDSEGNYLVKNTRCCKECHETTMIFLVTGKYLE